MAKDKGIILEEETTVAADAGAVLEFDPHATLIQDDDHLAEYLSYYGDNVGDGGTGTQRG